MYEQSFLNKLESAKALSNNASASVLSAKADSTSRANSISNETIALWKLYPATPTGASAAVKRDWAGKWLYYAKAGSTPGGTVRVYFDGGTDYVLMTPGSFVRGGFRGVALMLDAGNQDSSLYPTTVNGPPPADTVLPGAKTGVARFVYSGDADAAYTELASDAYAFAVPNYASYTPSYNVAAFGANIPTLPTQGVEVTNCRGVRALVYTPTAGATITSMSFRWWVFSPVMSTFSTELGAANGGWAPNNEVFPAPIVTAGQNKWALADYEVGIKYGRVYLEAINWVDSTAGVGNRRIILEAA